MSHTEFELIARHFSALGVVRDDVLLGVGDDCALLMPPADRKLAVSTDTLVSGVHFPEDAPPETVGHKAMAVNLSDLASMGAEPAWATLAVTAPSVNDVWFEGFSRGFGQIAGRYGVSLVGGDLCRGPLSITVHVTGFVPRGKALRRSGARPGDAIMVSGTLGDAGLGLALWRERREPPVGDQRDLVERLHRPTPRVELGLALRDCASAAIDVSDGLVSDLGHLLRASGVGAQVDVDRLPLSDAGLRLGGRQRILDMALRGGDDYELCFAVPRRRLGSLEAIASRVGVRLTRIGTVEPGEALRLQYADGSPVVLAETGYRHFPESV